MKQTFKLDSREVMGIVLNHLREEGFLRRDSVYTGSCWAQAKSRYNPMSGFEMTFEFNEEKD